MRPLACLVAAGMLALSAPVARAGEVAYGEAYDTLYQIGLATHTATEIGAAGRYGNQPIASISGLTTTPYNTVYAVSGGLKTLLRIDPSTGAATVVGSLGLSGQGTGQFDALDLGMTVGCDGTLWLSSGTTQKLWTVDSTSGATHFVGLTGHAISGLVEHNGVLLGAGAQGDDNLYEIDKQSGAATLIGSYGVSSWVNSVSMSFDSEGTLWAIVNYNPPETDSQPLADWSDLAKIDPATGAMEVIGPVTGPSSLFQIGMKGFVILPGQCGAVPAPAAAPSTSLWALLVLTMLISGMALRALPSLRQR